jgi:hypothetical protein
MLSLLSETWSLLLHIKSITLHLTVSSEFMKSLSQHTIFDSETRNLKWATQQVPLLASTISAAMPQISTDTNPPLPIQLSIQWVSGAPSMEVKPSEHKGDPLSSIYC